MKVASWALVGTHGDTISDPAQHDHISLMLSKEFEFSPAWPPIGNRNAKCHNGTNNMWFFPVDNTKGLEDESLQQLLACVEQTLDKSAYVHIKVPLSWFKVLDMMHEHQKDGPKGNNIAASFLTFTMIEQSCKQHNIHEVHDIEDMLQFFHEMGVLMWHRESSLRDMVILNPIDYFVSPATMLICKHVQEGDDTTFHFLDEHREAQQRYKFDWDKMIREGVVHRCIVETIWSKYTAEHQQLLIALCKKYGLLVSLSDGEDDNDAQKSAITQGDEEDDNMESHWFVPGILKEYRSQNNPFDETFHETSQSTFYFFFGISRMLEERNEAFYVEDAKVHGFLPSGLFERLIGKIVAWEHDKSTARQHVFTKIKAKNLIVFNLHQQMVRITLLEEENMLEVNVDGKGLLVIHHRLKDMLNTLISECLKELRFISLLSYPANQSVTKLKTQGNNAVQGSQQRPPFMFLRLNDLQHAFGEKSSFVTKQFSRGITPKEMLETYSSWLEMLMHHEDYDVFLSHRWMDRDKALVNHMFDCLTLTNTVVVAKDDPRGVRVFLDTCRLTAGRSFQEEFSYALIHTAVVISVISFEALRSMVDRSMEVEDNVLIEWMLALLCVGHQKTMRSRVRRILPVMLGFIDPVSKTMQSIYATGVINSLPDSHPTASVNVLKILLATHGISISDAMETQLAAWTVKSVVKDIMKNLGIEEWGLTHEDIHKQEKKKASLVDRACKDAMLCLHEALENEIADRVAQVGNEIPSKNNNVVSSDSHPTSNPFAAQSPTLKVAVAAPKQTYSGDRRPLETLSLEQILALLTQNGLKIYLDVFMSNHIDGSVLAGNTETDLFQALDIEPQKKLSMLWKKFLGLLQDWKENGIPHSAVLEAPISSSNKRELKSLQAEEFAFLLRKHHFSIEYINLLPENGIDGMILDEQSSDDLTEAWFGDIQSNKKDSIHWPRLLKLLQEWRACGASLD